MRSREDGAGYGTKLDSRLRYDPAVPRTSPRRLNRREFARALRLGLGRARIDVRRHGIARREDLLVAACLKSWTLDHQLEGSLSWWLLAIAKDAGVVPAV